MEPKRSTVFLRLFELNTWLNFDCITEHRLKNTVLQSVYFSDVCFLPQNKITPQNIVDLSLGKRYEDELPKNGVTVSQYSFSRKILRKSEMRKKYVFEVFEVVSHLHCS